MMVSRWQCYVAQAADDCVIVKHVVLIVHQLAEQGVIGVVVGFGVIDLVANWNKTRLSSHRISRLDRTVSKFSVADSLDLSPIQFTPPTPTRQDKTVLSCRRQRCELGITMHCHNDCHDAAVTARRNSVSSLTADVVKLAIISSDGRVPWAWLQPLATSSLIERPT